MRNECEMLLRVQRWRTYTAAAPAGYGGGPADLARERWWYTGSTRCNENLPPLNLGRRGVRSIRKSVLRSPLTLIQCVRGAPLPELCVALNNVYSIWFRFHCISLFVPMYVLKGGLLRSPFPYNLKPLQNKDSEMFKCKTMGVNPSSVE